LQFTSIVFAYVVDDGDKRDVIVTFETAEQAHR